MIDLAITADTFLELGQLKATEAKGPFVPAKVTATLDATTVTFEYGADAKWRMTHIDTYGNGNLITGPGCDATGFVVDALTMAILDELF